MENFIKIFPLINHVIEGVSENLKKTKEKGK